MKTDDHDDLELVRGGQGKTGAQVEREAFWFGVWFLVAGVIIGIALFGFLTK